MLHLVLPPTQLDAVFESFFSKLRTARGRTEDVCDPIEEPEPDPLDDLERFSHQWHIHVSHYGKNRVLLTARQVKALERAAEKLGQSMKPWSDYFASPPVLDSEEQPEPRYDKQAYTNLLPSIHRSHKRKRKGKQRR